MVHLINMYGQSGMINKSEFVYNSCDEFENNIETRKAVLNDYAVISDIDAAMSHCNSVKNDIDPGVYARLLRCCAAEKNPDCEKAKDIWDNIEDHNVKQDEFVISTFIDCMAKHGDKEAVLRFLLDSGYKYESGWLSLLSVCRRTNDLSIADKVYKYIGDIFAKEARTMGAASKLMSHSYAQQLQFDKQSKISIKMKR